MHGGAIAASAAHSPPTWQPRGGQEVTAQFRSIKEWDWVRLSPHHSPPLAGGEGGNSNWVIQNASLTWSHADVGVNHWINYESVDPPP